MDQDTGMMDTDSIWEYKFPSSGVPLRFDVEFFLRAREGGISSSKASGEPPLVLATTTFSGVLPAVWHGGRVSSGWMHRSLHVTLS